MSYPMLSPRRRRLAGFAPAGFTLVEVIIVIGIIAVLIAILLPTLSTVRELAKTTACLSNLRQIGTAAVNYAQQNDGYLVHGYASTQTTANGAPADAENYATTLVNARLIETPKPPSMGSGTTDQQSVFRCPSGSEELFPQAFNSPGDLMPDFNGRKDGLLARALRTKSVRTGVIVDTWYGINASINAPAIKSFYSRFPDGTAQLKRTFDVKDASRTVFLFDGIFANIHFDADRLHARHNGGTMTNILFADGHAASYDTVNLPGGLGPNPGGTDVFTPAALKAAKRT
ncbi:MAG TPA: prepilin-type N-terminal cleavage/methylation domain-containing protein, partial [Humisphaera sp.]